MRYSEKWPEYAKQWDDMKCGYLKGVPNSQAMAALRDAATFAIANKTRYLTVAARVKAHWAHIAAIHRRESDEDKNGNPRFDTYLGNGQPLSRRTTIVPRGRGPWATFEDGAADAWHVDALDDVIDWRLEKMLYYSEVLNGGGYSRKGLPSPYNWALTSIQTKGKYVGDGKWGNVWDTQPGVAPMLRLIQDMDKSVQYTRETP
jgi:lysozyme family protein